MKIKVHFLIILCTIVNSLAAQIPDDEKLHFWGDIDGFINQQDKVTLNLVHTALTKYKPAIEEPIERKMAMLMLDGVLHEEKAADRPAVQNFLRERIDLEDIDNVLRIESKPNLTEEDVIDLGRVKGFYIKALID